MHTFHSVIHQLMVHQSVCGLRQPQSAKWYLFIYQWRCIYIIYIYIYMCQCMSMCEYRMKILFGRQRAASTFQATLERAELSARANKAWTCIQNENVWNLKTVCLTNILWMEINGPRTTNRWDWAMQYADIGPKGLKLATQTVGNLIEWR